MSDTTLLLTSQIHSLEKEVTELRASLRAVTHERDALEVELQQMHDTVQILEASLQQQQQQQNETTPTATNLSATKNNKQHGAGFNSGVFDKSEDDATVLQRAQSVLLTARNRRLVQVAENSKHHLKKAHAAVKNVTGQLRADLILLRDSYQKGAKGILEHCRREFKHTLLPGIEATVGSIQQQAAEKKQSAQQQDTTEKPAQQVQQQVVAEDEPTPQQTPPQQQNQQQLQQQNQEVRFTSLAEAANRVTEEHERSVRSQQEQQRDHAQQDPLPEDPQDEKLPTRPNTSEKQEDTQNQEGKIKRTILDTPASQQQQSGAASKTPDATAAEAAEQQEQSVATTAQPPPPPAFSNAEIDAINERVNAIGLAEAKFKKFEITIRRLLLAVGRDGEAMGREWERIYDATAHLPNKLDHAIASCDVAARAYSVTHLHPQLRALCQDRAERAFKMLSTEVALLYEMMEEERQFGKPRSYSAIAAAHGFNHGEMQTDENGNMVYVKNSSNNHRAGDGDDEEHKTDFVTLHMALKALSGVHGCKNAAEELIAQFRQISRKHSTRTFDFIRRLRYVGAAAVPTVLSGISNAKNPSLTEFPSSSAAADNDKDNENESRSSLSTSRRGGVGGDAADPGPVLCFCTSCKTPLRCLDCMHSRIFGPRLDSSTLPAGSRFHTGGIRFDEIRTSVAAVFRRYAVERLRKALIERADERTEHALALTGIAEQAKVILMMQRRGALPVLPSKALASSDELAAKILIRQRELPHSASEQYFTRARVAILERERQLRREVIAAVNAKSVRAALDVASKKAASGASMKPSATAAAANGGNVVTGASLVLPRDAAELNSNNNDDKPTAVLVGPDGKPTPAALMIEAQRSWMPHLAMMVPVPPSALAMHSSSSNNNGSSTGRRGSFGASSAKDFLRKK